VSVTLSGLRHRSRLALLVCGVIAAVAGCLSPGAEVPYVQTPTDVVTEMLRIASVGANDVVYDLGSGDGRIVIAAARDFGARGVGIEIDPGLVAYSTELARKAGVADRVTFRSDDLFEVDLSDATVVTLYLSYSMNQRLRPKLLRELRPGSRIVSHDYDLGADWPASKTVQVPWRDRTSHVYLWVVPPRS
jgi:SAM-dependent methyltransferase